MTDRPPAGPRKVPRRPTDHDPASSDLRSNTLHLAELAMVELGIGAFLIVIGWVLDLPREPDEIAGRPTRPETDDRHPRSDRLQEMGDWRGAVLTMNGERRRAGQPEVTDGRPRNPHPVGEYPAQAAWRPGFPGETSRQAPSVSISTPASAASRPGRSVDPPRTSRPIRQGKRMDRYRKHAPRSVER